MHSHGGDIQVVYSPVGALEPARKLPCLVVFRGMGFENKTAIVAGSILCAASEGLSNYLVLQALKLKIRHMAT